MSFSVQAQQARATRLWARQHLQVSMDDLPRMDVVQAPCCICKQASQAHLQPETSRTNHQAGPQNRVHSLLGSQERGTSP
jgi:hypothetical protein